MFVEKPYCFKQTNKLTNKQTKDSINMNEYRYQLERYRGRGTRYVCPQCGRKYSFTRYIDTHNNNEYVNERVGKCNRLDKCGYHYTSKQYFADNPWLSEKRDNVVALLQNIGKSNKATATKRASERISCEELVISNVKRLRLFIREIKEFKEFREMVSRETLNSLNSLNSLISLRKLGKLG